MNSYVINAQNRLIAHALKSINPELYQICLEVPRPLLIDYRHIDFIHYEFKHQFGNVDLDNKTIYVACIYRLYNPSHLYGKFNKLPLGLRDEIARSLGYTNPENINAIAAPAPAHYKNPRTAKTINDFADSVYSILKQCDELSSEEKLSGCSTAQTILDLKKYVADPAYRSNAVATK